MEHKPRAARAECPLDGQGQVPVRTCGHTDTDTRTLPRLPLPGCRSSCAQLRAKEPPKKGAERHGPRVTLSAAPQHTRGRCALSVRRFPARSTPGAEPAPPAARHARGCGCLSTQCLLTDTPLPFYLLPVQPKT